LKPLFKARVVGYTPAPPFLVERRKRGVPRWRWWVTTVLLVLFILVVAAAVVLRWKGDEWARRYVVQMLAQKYGARVELERLSIRLFPGIRATGGGLVVRRHGQESLPPFLAVRGFAVDTTFSALLHDPWHVRHTRLEGLEIHIPPKGSRSAAGRRKFHVFPEFVIDEILADGTVLEILTSRPGKLPLRFEIANLTLHSIGRDRHLSFRASLTNPKPPGQIQTQGNFGPWYVDDPARTPVAGQYTFRNADLAVFKGISGALSSDGRYSGVLERIAVQGTTDVPQFAVGISGNPVHLRTEFDAVVDGTNGDTLLQPVKASWGESSITAAGKIVGQTGVKGKAVVLNVTASEARLEDLLRLAIKSNVPPMTGIVSFNMGFHLPPGDQDISDKLALNGTFALRSARFTTLRVQKKLAGLSRRARGLEVQDADERVVSNLSGRLRLEGGIADFSALSFGVPGAEVRLNGRYGLRREQMDFRGELRMQAKLSQTTHGIKSLLLKPLDPLFSRPGAGMVLPIKITGARAHPNFGVEIGRIFKRH
jgi:hypothetical protein